MEGNGMLCTPVARAGANVGALSVTDAERPPTANRVAIGGSTEWIPTSPWSSTLSRGCPQPPKQDSGVGRPQRPSRSSR